MHDFLFRSAGIRLVLPVAILVLSLVNSSGSFADESIVVPEGRRSTPLQSADGKRVQQATEEQPGLNDRFLDPELKIEEWLDRFEVESREVFAARERVLDLCRVEPGMIVADVGAGTGFYSRLFAAAAGKSGWVYAVELSPSFAQHINRQAQKDRVTNLTTVLCTERSVCLPPSSVDRVFLCDTYHHFEHPSQTLASIYRALKPGGQMIVIDFERIPGVSREFIVGHVRAGKDVFRREIEDAGFQFVEEVKVASLRENYLLRFQKSAGTAN